MRFVQTGRIAPVVLLLLCGLQASAQQPANKSKDEADVRQAGKDYLAAIEHGDVKALADLWSTDGTYVDPSGKSMKVKDLLAEWTAKAGDAQIPARPRATVDNVKIRFLGNDVAVEDGDCESVGGSAAKECVHYSAIWSRQNGKWKLDTLRETASTPATSPVAEQLATLDVFVGKWSGQINGSTITVNAKWDANKKFLSREFSIAIGKAALTGTQQVGWDPLSDHIRSWMFMDDGSRGDSIWSREGTAWLVVGNRVLPDGKTSTSTQVFKFPDKNTIVWKSIRGAVDGLPTDDFEVVLKRVTR
jgi:uncharacterized protein (TIGR02246 family)